MFSKLMHHFILWIRKLLNVRIPAAFENDLYFDQNCFPNKIPAGACMFGRNLRTKFHHMNISNHMWTRRFHSNWEIACAGAEAIHKRGTEDGHMWSSVFRRRLLLFKFLFSLCPLFGHWEQASSLLKKLWGENVIRNTVCYNLVWSLKCDPCAKVIMLTHA